MRLYSLSCELGFEFDEAFHLLGVVLVEQASNPEVFDCIFVSAPEVRCPMERLEASEAFEHLLVRPFKQPTASGTKNRISDKDVTNASARVQSSHSERNVVDRVASNINDFEFGL